MRRTEQLVSKTEMSTLRTIASFTRWDMKRNDEIRQICDVQDVIKWSRKRRKEWNRHVLRMGDQRLAKMALRGKPSTTRPPRRPPKRWHECRTSSSADILSSNSSNSYPVSLKTQNDVVLIGRSNVLKKKKRLFY